MIKNVLIACEESQTTCIEFRKLGFNAFSCDLQSSTGGFPQYHIKGDCLQYLEPCEEFNGIGFYTEDNTYHCVPKWDLIIAHPPCTMLARVSSAAFRSGLHSSYDVQVAREFFFRFYDLKRTSSGIRLCIENPVPMKISNLPKYSQIIQPYQFGDLYTKQTCLWLYNLPPLFPTSALAPYGSTRNIFPSWVGTHFGSVQRSKSFVGIARAMANQWGFLD